MTMRLSEDSVAIIGEAIDQHMETLYSSLTESACESLQRDTGEVIRTTTLIFELLDAVENHSSSSEQELVFSAVRSVLGSFSQVLE